MPAAFRRLCVETPDILATYRSFQPAAFRRLCVETTIAASSCLHRWTQPPSGGCVLKHTDNPTSTPDRRQPPSGGCVLKHYQDVVFDSLPPQPPSGGCVLKPYWGIFKGELPRPAAFRRLCVETMKPSTPATKVVPAAFRRLCVETNRRTSQNFRSRASRLQAAVC